MRLPQGVGVRSWGRLQRPGGGLARFCHCREACSDARKIRDLAMSEHSIELGQLVSRVAAMYVEVSDGVDPFAEEKGIDQRQDRECGGKSRRRMPARRRIATKSSRRATPRRRSNWPRSRNSVRLRSSSRRLPSGRQAGSVVEALKVIV